MKRYLTFILTLALLPLLLVSGCASTPARYQESGLNSRFEYAVDLPYASYIEQSRAMVEKTRVDLTQANRNEIIAANIPFELRPNESLAAKTPQGKYAWGILLIHGLSDSPYHIKYIARHLADQGFLVRGLLLPGHGTIPGDLTEVTYEEWIKATEYGVNSLRREVENLYVGGFSTGGALAVQQGLVRDDLAGLLLFAPALKVHGAAWLTVYLRHVKTWLDSEADLDFAKYESFTTNAAAQIYRLTQAIGRLVESGRRIEIPVFGALSLDDATVNSDYTMEFFQKYMGNAQSRLLLYGNKPKAELKNDLRLILTPSSFPDEQVLDFAHTSITTPPSDPHYGRNGEYRNCLHYSQDSAERQSCLTGTTNLKGERTDDNLKKGILQRLTYNPDYDRMIERIDTFLTQ